MHIFLVFASLKKRIIMCQLHVSHQVSLAMYVNRDSILSFENVFF